MFRNIFKKTRKVTKIRPVVSTVEKAMKEEEWTLDHIVDNLSFQKAMDIVNGIVTPTEADWHYFRSLSVQVYNRMQRLRVDDQSWWNWATGDGVPAVMQSCIITMAFRRAWYTIHPEKIAEDSINGGAVCLLNGASCMIPEYNVYMTHYLEYKYPNPDKVAFMYAE